MRLLLQRSPVCAAIHGLLIALLALTGPVAAIDIAVTGNVQDWALIPGTTNENATAIHLNVSTANAPWSVTVTDALDNGKSSSSVGRMLEYNPISSSWINGGSILAANLTVIGGSVSDVTGSTATLGPTGKLIESGSAAADKKQMNITLQQPVAITDRRLTNGDVYRVIIVFTGTES